MTRPTVVILLSDKRSGSTILQTEMLSHPGVRGLHYTSHTYLESHHWLKAAVMTGMPARLFAGGAVYPGYGAARNARTYMIDTIRGNLPDFVPPQDDAALIRDGWEALCHRFAAPVFFEKSPQVLANWAAISLLLDWMETTEFTVKLVGLVRNPLAVQYSSERLFGSLPARRQFGWVEIQRNLLALRQMLSPEQLMILRHEDIIADPTARFTDLCAHVGLEPHPAMGAQVSDRTQDRWREDPDYALALDPAVKQVARALGYSDEELDNPHAVVQSRHAVARVPRRTPSQIKNHFRDRVLRPYLMRRRSPYH
jgi:hypothetical protein